jgi:hypothetical protein
MSEFPWENEEIVITDSFSDEDLFIIASSDPWYGEILVYLQTMNFSSHYSRDDRRQIFHLMKNYLIIDDTLYHRGVLDLILRHFLNHEEA